MKQITPLEQLTGILYQYADWFHQHIPPERHDRYVQIVTLRETKSHAIFTTEGTRLDVERLQAGVKHTQPIDRVLMYKRKQIAPERRKGKALLRAMGMLTVVEVGKDKQGKPITKDRAECQIMGNSCGYCPDCILYGYAATTGSGSQKSRVFSDSGYLVRGRLATRRDITFNAIQDTTAGGIAGSAFNSRENVLPQVFLPMVETLVDVTIPEFLYVLGNILKTTRYGAESSREGFLRNHLLGIYFSDAELFSNLELTQRYYDILTGAAQGTLPDYLSLEDFTIHWDEVEQGSCSSLVGQYQKLQDLDGLREGIHALYANKQALRSMLQALDDETLRYALTVKTAATRRAKGKGRSGAASEEAPTGAIIASTNSDIADEADEFDDFDDVELEEDVEEE